MQDIWPDTVKAVYVLCHPIKEKGRYDRLMPHLKAVGIPEDRIRVCAPTWGTDLTPEQIFTAYNPYLNRGIPSFTFKAASLSRGEISLGINFAMAVLDSVKRADDGIIITLESDVWLREDFVPRLVELLADASKPWDFISLGEGVGTRPVHPLTSYYGPTKAYQPPHKWVFRCTDSMMFTTGYLQRLAQTVLPFKEIIDWEMNYQLMLHKGVALWADPPLAEQGTCNARLMTSLAS
jgi:hypothetical protein